MSRRFDKDSWILRALADGTYVAREDGSIWKFKRRDEATGKRIYKRVQPCVHKRSGRVYFNMTYEGVTKSVLINRMVALRFLPNPENKPQVNHLDGDKANNAKGNLEWATQSENEEHAFATGLKSTRGSSNANAKLTAREVEEIRAAQPQRLEELAIQYDVSTKTIRDIREGRTWKHV
jgi:hypothetical protein